MFALPPLALAIWGGLYIDGCIKVFEQPFYDLSFGYQGSKGWVTGFAKQAQFNFGAGELRARGVALQEERSPAVATANRLTVVAPLPWNSTVYAYKVQLDGGDFVIERRPDGSWSFQDLVPAPTGKPLGKAAYEIRARNANIVFRDLAVAHPAVWRGAASELSVSGTEEGATVGMDVQVEGVGIANGRLDIHRSHIIFVQLKSPNLKLIPVKRYLMNWKGLRKIKWLNGWSASEAIYKGNFTVQPFVVDNKPVWRVRGTGSADARDLHAFNRNFSTFHFAGSFSEAYAAGTFSAQSGASQATATGALTFTPRLAGTFEGQAFATSDSVARMLAGRLWPSGLKFTNAHYNGSLSFDKGYLGSGLLQAQSVSYAGYSAQNVNSAVMADGKTIRLRNVQASAMGTRINGQVALTLGKSPQIRAYAVANNVDISAFKQIPRQTISGGRANVQLLVTGSVSKPEATLRATGHAILVLHGKNATHREQVDVSLAGKVRQGKLFVSAAEVSGKSGVFRGSGVVALNGKSLDLNVTANSIDISAHPDSQAQGIAYADMTVNGSISNPRANGLVEIYNGQIDKYSLPFISSRANYQNKTLALTDISARSGAALITGQAKIGFDRTAALSGSGQVLDLALGQFTDENLEGLVEGAWSLGGTWHAPVIAGDMVAESVVAGKLEARDLKAKGKWADGALHLERVTANLGTGKLEANGTWKPKGESTIAGTLTDVPASLFQAYADETSKIGGFLSGEAKVNFLNGELSTGGGQLRLKDFVVNDEPIGSGFFEANIANRKVNVTGQVGSLEGYYLLNKGEYDLDKNTLSASVSTLDASVKEALRLVSSTAGKNWTYDQKQELLKVDGKFSVNGDIALQYTKEPAKPAYWKVTAASGDFVAHDLLYAQKPIGNAEVAIEKQGPLYTFKTASITGGPASLRLRNARPNYIDEQGDISLDGEFYNVDVNWLKNLNPDLGALSGLLDASFVVSGKTEAPVVQTSLNATNLKYGDFAADVMTLGPLLVRQGEISGLPTKAPDEPLGRLQVRGFEAQLMDAHIPFKYPLKFPSDQPLSARIVVPDRDINDLSRFFGGLDAKQTSGRLTGGEFLLSGTLDDLQTSGSITANASKIKFDSLDFAMVNVSAAATLQGPVLKITADGASALGGTFLLNSGVDFKKQSYSDGSHVKLTDFQFAQPFGTASRANGIVNTDLSIAGDLFEPLVTGAVVARNAGLVVSGEFPVREPSGAIPLNPYFDIKLELQNARVANGPLDAETHGTGYLRGPLAQADAHMDFALDGGEISLPTGRIRLEPGGTAVFKYGADWRGIAAASLNVDLNASTRVTADSGLGLQRYLISLHITGDLLSKDELTIDATSDPPDLSRNQILAVLGQQKLFENVASVGFGDFNAQIKNLLSSVAAPALSNILSRSLEKALGFEYIGFDLSPSGVAGLTLAKALGHGFTLEYRRVLEQFAVGGESLEEIKLTYRPLSTNPILGRLTLGLAADRTGLLKLSLGYTRRF